MTTKTVADKLLVKPGTTLWLSHPDRLALVGPLPDGVREAAGPQEAAVALVFGDDAASLREVLAEHEDGIATPPVVWVAYPKANKTDINRDTVWPIVGEFGLRPNGQVAIDEVWSALRFRALKPGEAPFAGGR
ncbi:hypothetical protein [Nonomuraea africana]|uniref:DUF3052 domain-containing protein n=1 Tax=Nonomuraea africana TaxID=46171 RepID=A0ABR9KC47_9ACTN|nr:hypothetical protein [Nonomuraea africana]MBE1559376.1 hypothetical protein [Nonomuraea africana]